MEYTQIKFKEDGFAFCFPMTFYDEERSYGKIYFLSVKRNDNGQIYYAITRNNTIVKELKLDREEFKAAFMKLTENAHIPTNVL